MDTSGGCLSDERSHPPSEFLVKPLSKFNDFFLTSPSFGTPIIFQSD